MTTENDTAAETRANKPTAARVRLVRNILESKRNNQFTTDRDEESVMINFIVSTQMGWPVADHLKQKLDVIVQGYEDYLRAIDRISTLRDRVLAAFRRRLRYMPVSHEWMAAVREARNLIQYYRSEFHRESRT